MFLISMDRCFYDLIPPTSLQWKSKILEHEDTFIVKLCSLLSKTVPRKICYPRNSFSRIRLRTMTKFALCMQRFRSIDNIKLAKLRRGIDTTPPLQREKGGKIPLEREG